MAIKIRKNENIQGFKCLDRNIKESLYADDTTLLLSDLNSLDAAIDTVNQFSNVAGPKLNLEKSEGVLLGPLKNTMDKYKNIKFTNDAIRVLGIYIGHDKEKCHEKNWNEKINKIRLIFERWKYRNLTMFGKILIIKSLAISKFIHTMSIIETPPDVLKEIEKTIYNFLWDKNERIKRKTLIGPKYMGGMGMIDIESKDKALKAGWLKRIHTKNPNSDFLNMRLSKKGIDCDYLVKSSCTQVDIIQNSLNIPSFWAKVFAYANECKSFKQNTVISDSEFLSEPIWFNKRLMLSNKPVFISNWTKSGILYVKDLYINGIFINENDCRDKLIYKANWMSEYIRVKKMFKKITHLFNTENAQFINIKKTWTLLNNNNLHCMKYQKSTFYYEILIKKKCIRNYMEKVWERDFNVEINWQSIYITRVWKNVDRKLAEFNYKILCNIINTRTNISRWNRNINENCQYCGTRQTPRHLLIECTRVQDLWAVVGKILKMDIYYRHIVLGNNPHNDLILKRNMVISYIAYSIYKFWILAENNKVNFATDCLFKFVKKDLFSRTVYLKDQEFTRICDKITTNL